MCDRYRLAWMREILAEIFDAADAGDDADWRLDTT
jgi:hypothetical protein